MKSTPHETAEPIYLKLANLLEGMIASHSLRPGDRVPSVRHFSSQQRVSIPTALQAYTVLESRRLIEARPKSGFFVRARLADSVPAPKAPPPSPVRWISLMWTLWSSPQRWHRRQPRPSRRRRAGRPIVARRAAGPHIGRGGPKTRPRRHSLRQRPGRRSPAHRNCSSFSRMGRRLKTRGPHHHYRRHRSAFAGAPRDLSSR